MAIVKHIKSRNANYSAAINYLLFEHDEKTGKKILDKSGRSILRKEFYMDGVNCDPMSFDKEFELTNARFHKNKKREDIKSHHYIISYDPPYSLRRKNICEMQLMNALPHPIVLMNSNPNFWNNFRSL
ncbi:MULTISPECIES: hypothetical protein [Clostridia]|uniref:hypothetical protein n=1 Tax=Clostridia TaxID=186801 RepID=UPI001FA9FCE6|nr:MULTISPECIES: hypothetical protein [Clostridia]